MPGSGGVSGTAGEIGRRRRGVRIGEAVEQSRADRAFGAAAERPSHEAVDVGLLLFDSSPEFGDGGEEFLVYPSQVRGLGPQGGEVGVRGRFGCHTPDTRHARRRFGSARGAES